MAEFTQFTITARAKEVADTFVEEGWFSAASEVGVFAAAHVLKYHFNDVNPTALKYSNGAHNYSYATFDPDNSWQSLLSVLYKTDSPRECFRNIIIWGLENIGDEIENNNGAINILDYI